VFGGEHRKFVPVKNAIAILLLAIAAFDQLLVLSLESLQLGLKCGLVHLAWAVVVVVKLIVSLKHSTLNGIIRQSRICVS
jgi:hypothetical protein